MVGLRSTAVAAALVASACVPPVDTGERPNTPPVAALRAPVIAPTHRDVELNASASGDLDGEALLYRLDVYGGVAMPAGSAPVVTTDPIFYVRFPAAGLYTLELTVTDLHGASATAIQDVAAREDYPDPPAFCRVAADCVVGDECDGGVCYANGGGEPLLDLDL